MIPRAARWAAAAWLAAWLPLHLAAWPATSLLWYCAHGAILAVIGIVLGSRLVVSSQAVALLVPQTLFVAEALARLVTGARGGGTSYLFDPAVPAAVRALSSFHFVMPLVLVWAVRRLGYDRRALPLAIATGTLVNVVSRAFGPINVWAWPWAREHAAAALLLAPLVLWLPADRVLRRMGAPPAGNA
jgi:hypothetical protein